MDIFLKAKRGGTDLGHLPFALCGMLAVSAAAEEPSFANVVRGPYLQNLTPSTITVRWRTDAPVASVVRFSAGPRTGIWEVGDPDLKTEHSITLNNLTADTGYQYQIESETDVLSEGPDHFFYTGPAVKRPTRIWVIGDSGSALPGAKAVYTEYLKFTGNRYTDAWLMLGDNAYYSGTDEEYQTAVFDMYPELLHQPPLWSTMGNHETYSSEENGEHAYFNNFTLPKAGEAGGEPSGTEHYYSFNYGNIHVVCLDSEESARTPGSPMLVWLEEDLAANTKDWTIVMWHSPPYTKGSHDSDSIFDTGGSLVQMRQNIVPIIESYGVDLVLCGHSHNYERSFLMDGHFGFSDSLTPSMIKDSGSGQPGDTGPYLKEGTGPNPNQGTVYVVAGSSGWATFQTGYHPIMHTALLRMGSLVLDIQDHRLDAKFLRETGVIDDHFTIVKGASPEPLHVVKFQTAEGYAIIHWKSRAGRAYRVEMSGTLEAPQWTPISEDVQATGATTMWEGIANAQNGRAFLRVVEAAN